jgi:pimeloyl-ACP methyl ester carboxylesterase
MPEPVKQAILTTAGKTFREWALGFETEMPFRALAKLSVPTLVVSGSESNRTTARICDLIRTFVPNARKLEIAGGGHMCPLTHADAVNRAIAMQIGDRSADRRAFAA